MNTTTLDIARPTTHFQGIRTAFQAQLTAKRAFGININPDIEPILFLRNNTDLVRRELRDEFRRSR